MSKLNDLSNRELVLRTGNLIIGAIPERGKKWALQMHEDLSAIGMMADHGPTEEVQDEARLMLKSCYLGAVKNLR